MNVSRPTLAGALVVVLTGIGSAPAATPTTRPAKPATQATTAPTLKGDLAEVERRLGFQTLAALDKYILKEAETRFDAWRAAAESGDPAGEYFLGRCYLVGTGVPRNTVEGVAWLKRAAEKRLRLALDELGNCFHYGKGVRRDRDEAIKYYTEALDGGLSLAMTDIGTMFQEAIEGPAKPPSASDDDKIALSWFRRAAEKGDSWGMMEVGNAYNYGKGVPVNLTTAAQWYRKSAEKGNVSAMTELGILLGNRDDKEGMEWLQRAVDAGDNEQRATMEIGRAYEDGTMGLKKDHAEAVKWFEKADNAGNSEASDWLATFR